MDQALAETPERTTPAHGVTLAEAFRVWFRVALLSFGGPAGQIAVMHKILVEEKRWISENRFLHALNYCMLLPGPEAQQLATYIGWLMHRTLGGIMAGGLFILAGIISILLLSIIYAAYGRIGFVAALFFGLKAAVLAIVIEAVCRIGKRALKNKVMLGLAAAAFIGLFFLNVPFPWIVFGAGLIGFIGGGAGLPQFVIGGQKPANGNTVGAEDLLGNELPAHARPSAARALAASTAQSIAAVPILAIAQRPYPLSKHSETALHKPSASCSVSPSGPNHRRRLDQNAIEPAASPAHYLPRLRALALLRRQPPPRADASLIPASDKPAQKTTFAAPLK